MAVDNHVLKMGIESAQMMSTAHRMLDGELYYERTKNGRKIKRWRLHDQREEVLYKATHYNHPSNVWVRTAVENYNWMVDHLHGLLSEFEHRYGKKHKTADLLYQLGSPPLNLKKWDWTTPPLCMDDVYKRNGVVDSYRNFYNKGKAHLHGWKNREVPEWITTQ